MATTTRVSNDVVEVAVSVPADARVTDYVVEAVVEYVAPSPSTPTGGGVSQFVVEAVVLAESHARVSDYVMEVVTAPDLDVPTLARGTIAYGGVA